MNPRYLPSCVVDFGGRVVIGTFSTCGPKHGSSHIGNPSSARTTLEDVDSEEPINEEDGLIVRIKKFQECVISSAQEFQLSLQ